MHVRTIAVGVLLMGPAAAQAACDQATLQRLLDQGFTKAEILAVCGPGTAALQPPLPPPPATTQPQATQPPPLQATPPQATRQHVDPGDALAGTWEGVAGMNRVQLIFLPDGTYQLSYWLNGARPGTPHVTQVGTWSVEKSRITMTQTGGTPPPPKVTHPETDDFELAAGNTVLTLTSPAGSVRLTRRL